MKETLINTRRREWCYSQTFFTSELMSIALDVTQKEAFRLCKKFVNDGTIEFHGFEEKVDGCTGQCRNIYKPKNKPSTYDLRDMTYVFKGDIPTVPIKTPMVYIVNGEPMAVLVPIDKYNN